MRLRNRPLLAGGLDKALYVGRPELERPLHRALRDERNVLLVGERRSGRTSLLRKIIADSPEVTFGLVDAGLASTTHDLIRLIGRALGGDSRLTGEASDNDPVDLLDALGRLPREPGTVVVLDGDLNADVGYNLFGRMRDALWRLPYTWIVTATPDEAGNLRTPPADAFWSLVLEVGSMDGPEIDELLRRGLTDQEREQLARNAEGEMPRQSEVGHVVRWAQDVLDGNTPTRDAELQERARRLGRQASMALSELLALGRPAAAGDPELLKRLGWTRPNAARWLSKMEDAGILRSFIGASEGQGRPPKLYEPIRTR